MITKQQCLEWDRADPLRHLRDRYHVPDGVIYLDGNSLGLMPKAAVARVEKAVRQEWGNDLITSWNKHRWFQLPRVTGDKIARLIGGGNANVIVADTISVNIFKALTSALPLRRGRNVIVSDSGNFPSDLYVAQGLNTFLDGAYEIRIVAPQDAASAITDDVAVVMLTEVDYRTARLHDMKALTRIAHDKGALTIWDLAHSAGAIPVDLLGADADFAVGCTYKYLNGGPGAPAFIFVNPQHQDAAQPALAGWWGHEDPFAFDLEFRPAKGIVRQQCGTQAILNIQALDAALDQWADVNMHAVKAKAGMLCQTFISLVEGWCPDLRLAGPRDIGERGSHVSFHCQEGYAVMQALIARGVIGDFRAPDLIRFGFAPCYNSLSEVHAAAAHIADILKSRGWDKPQFRNRKAVT